MATRVYNVVMLAIFMAFLATSSLAVRPSITYTSGAGVMGESYPCCDTCSCTSSIPPQCRCTDIKTCPTAKPCCHSSCKNCGCTRSIPPKCWCADIKNYCDAPCPFEALLLKTAVVKDF